MARRTVTGDRPARSSTPAPADVPVELALVDPDGVIVAVNDAWTAFAEANGGDPARTGVGSSYLDACDTADDPYSAAVAHALRTALGGGLPAPLQVAVPCHAPAARRWFDVLVSSRFDDAGRCIGAAVTLSPVHSSAVGGPSPVVPSPAASDPAPAAAVPAEPAYYTECSERLGDVFAQVLLDHAPVGILVVDDHGIVLRAGRAADALLGHGRGRLEGRHLHCALPGLELFATLAGDPDGGVGTVGEPVMVDSVAADGSIRPVEVQVGRLPLTRGTGAVVLLHPPVPGSHALRPDQRVYTDGEIDRAVEGLDGVMRDLFSSGLTVAGLAGARPSDLPLATALLGVTDELDRAVGGLRSVAYRLHRGGRRGAPPA